MNAIILCGGLSTRLGDITKDIPKVLLDIGGRTVLNWQLRALKRAGFTSVVLAAGHLADVLRAEVGDEREGLRISYAIEDKKLGTGGAIKNALSMVEHPDQPTIILNGDVLSGADLSEMVGAMPASSKGLLLATRVDDVSTYGTLVYNEQRELKEFREKEKQHKPGYINGGVYFFHPRVVEHFPHVDTFSIEYDVLPYVDTLHVYESDAPWVDVGVPERLAWARENWKLFE